MTQVSSFEFQVSSFAVHTFTFQKHDCQLTGGFGSVSGLIMIIFSFPPYTYLTFTLSHNSRHLSSR